MGKTAIQEEQVLAELKEATLERLRANDAFHRSRGFRPRLYLKERRASQRAVAAATRAMENGIDHPMIVATINQAVQEFRSTN